MGDGAGLDEISRYTEEDSMSTQPYREGHCTAEVVNYEPFVSTSKDGREFRKFGIILKIIEEGHPDQGRTEFTRTVAEAQGGVVCTSAAMC